MDISVIWDHEGPREFPFPFGPRLAHRASTPYKIHLFGEKRKRYFGKKKKKKRKEKRKEKDNCLRVFGRFWIFLSPTLGPFGNNSTRTATYLCN
jgi:hypothetical protein